MNYNRNIRIKCDDIEFTKLYSLFEYLYTGANIRSIYEMLDYPIIIPQFESCDLDKCNVISDDIKPFLDGDISEEIKAVIRPHLVEKTEWTHNAQVKDLAWLLDLDEKVLLKIAFKWLHEI